MNNQLSSSLLLVLQTLLLNLMNVKVVSYMSYVVGKDLYGAWVTAFAIGSLITTTGTLGLRANFLRAVAQNPDDGPELLIDQLSLRLVIALVFFVGGLLLLPLLAYPVVVTMSIAILLLGALVWLPATALADVLQALGHMRYSALVNFCTGIVLNVLTIVVCYLFRRIEFVAALYPLTQGLSLVLFLYFVRRLAFPVHLTFRTTAFRQLLVESRLNAFRQVVTNLQGNLEQLVIPKMIGLAESGVFFVGSMPVNRLVIIPDSLASAFYGKIAAIKRDEKQPNQIAAQLLLLSLMFCLPLGILIYFWAGPLAQFFLHKNYQAGQSIIELTAVALPLIGVEMAMSYTVEAAGSVAKLSRRLLYASAVIMLASVVLIYRWGLLGASVALLLKPILRSFGTFPLYRGVARFPGARFAFILATGCGMFGLMWLLRGYCAASIWGLILVSFGSSVLYVGILLLFKPLGLLRLLRS